MATIDVLGEHLETAEQARELVREYDEVFDAIEQNGLDSNVSIKLTALGLAIDRELCLENAEAVVAHARESGELRSHRHGGVRLHDADAGDLPRAARRAATTTSASSSSRACAGRCETSARSPT